MLKTFSLVFLPLIAAAQSPSPEVEKALQERATEFFQYHVDGNYRKAMDLVAEDTKDEYFAQGKMKLKSFKLDSIKFSDPAKAVVTATVVRDWQIRLEVNEVIVPMVTTWKIEDGKWVWYHDRSAAWLTPMGPSTVQPPTRNPDGSVNLPKDFSAELINQAARTILSQSGISKGEVNLSATGTSEDKVTFNNGAPGAVRLSLAGVPELPGFRVELDKTEVLANGQAQVTIRYQAPADAPPAQSFMIRVVSEPFNQVFPIRVNFEKPAQ
jgi:hypothetical protein